MRLAGTSSEPPADLRQAEPQPGDEEHLLGPALLAALEPEARERLRPWVREAARRVTRILEEDYEEHAHPRKR